MGWLIFGLLMLWASTKMDAALRFQAFADELRMRRPRAHEWE